jgi:hypothetical protein
MHVGSLEFDEATEATLQILHGVAGTTDGLMTYGELSSCLASEGFKVPAFPGPMPHLLAAASVREVAEGRGLISAVVVNGTTRMPSSGFFRVARERFGRAGDDMTLWLTECQRLRAEHATL